MATLAGRLRRRPWPAAAVAAGLALLLAAAVLVLYARGGGELPAPLRFLAPAAPSLDGGPAEEALRTLRLAGYDHAVVGEEDGTIVVRLAVPSVASPADVELSWQTALAVGASAYPRSEEVVAQVFSGSQALVQVSAPAEEVRTAEDAAALERVAEFTYLSTAGGE